MKAIIITIGDELLIGQTVDTNSAWLGAELSKSGFDVMRIISVHDRRDDILNVLGEVTGKSDVVIMTGGLGPTDDDITKTTLCEFFNTRLIVNEEVLAMVTEMMHRRNYTLNERNRKQAEVPEACKVLKNSSGTAPGMWFEKSGTVFISLPGIPYEMKFLMQHQVFPGLNKRFRSQAIIHRTIMTYGTFESKLAEQLESFESELPDNLKLAYLPESGVIKLRLTGKGTKAAELKATMDEQVGKLSMIIPDLIFSTEEETLEMVIGRLLREKNMSVSTAESCTGGEIAHLITSIPGSSDYFQGSVVAYSNSVKTTVLGVSENTLLKFGAVSEQTVREMAVGARQLLGSDFAVATSGIAGPDGATTDKPVGTIWIAVASNKGTATEKYIFGNDRLVNIKRFAVASLNLLRKQIISY